MTVQQDRRDARARRIPFEALVEIGGDGPAFEAECVDISTGGMHLRSAYLPELGQPIVCRFDSGEGEPICAEGHVVWRDEGSLGGELGIQFTNVDEPSAEALLEMCGVAPAEIEPAIENVQQPSKSELVTGSRIRLHIEGLGAPMKARVRKLGDKQLLVGSNLDFLRLGRPLELESVDVQEKRPAQVERVSVEVDPASKVPQLIVELRYTDIAHEPAAAAPSPKKQIVAAPVALPEPDEDLDAIDDEDEDELPEEPAFDAQKPAFAAASPIADDEVEVAHRMKDGLSRAASRALPAIASMGSRAKTTVELLFAKSRDKDDLDRVSLEEAPRRTTAPAPSGALQALGRKVVREEEPAISAPTSRVSKKRSRAIALGAATGVVTVLLLAIFRSPSTPPPGASDLATAASVPAEVPALEAAQPAPEPTFEASPDIVVANVPLFGPTPLSTTVTPAPAAPAAEELQAEAPSALPAPREAAALEMAALDDDPDFPVAQTTSRKPREVAKKAAPAPKKVAAFTHGKVQRPKTLRLRMDDAITSLKGSRSADGFTVLLPARRAKEKAGPLASKDERILQSRVLNGSKGAELTIRFKDEVPAFAVRADGSDLVIELETGKKTKPSVTAKKGKRRN